MLVDPLLRSRFPPPVAAFGRDRIAKTIYDAASQVVKVQSGLGDPNLVRDEVTSTYTPNGRLATVTDAEANRTTYEYDLFDRPAKTRYPSKTIPNQSSTLDFELFEYDAGSRVTSRTLRDGTVIALGYDDLNRLVLKDLPGTETSVTYSYDWLNRMMSAAQGNVDVTFVHDALSRVTESTAFLASGINLTTAYQYDLAGRRTRITHDDGFVVTYNHLVTGEMASVREGVFGDPASVMLATYDYDDRGRRIAINRNNGMSTTYAYDPISRLTALTQNLLGGNDDLALGFSNYNPAGQIGRTTRDNDSYVFDDHAAGTIPSIPNGLNQLTQVDAETLQYDPRGNLTSDASAPGGTASYTYSAENMLTSATVGGQQVTLQYDPLMRLRTTSGAAVRRFVHDGVDLISEHNGPGTLVRRYVHGPGMDEPLVEYTGTDNTTRRWLHADERGSIVAISDGTGAAVVKNTYDEYGNPGAANDGRFQYTGQTWIPELRLYYYKARFYDPRLGRFMQTDPIGYDGGMNLYAYVGDDPVNFTDPSGLFSRGDSLSSFTKTTYFTTGGTVTRYYVEEYIERSWGEERVSLTEVGRSYSWNSFGDQNGLGLQFASLDPAAGRAAAPPQKEEEPSIASCAYDAVAEDPAGAALAALGGAAFVLSTKARIAGALVGGTVSVAALGYSAATEDGIGGVISLAGKGTANAGGIASVGSAFARGAKVGGGVTAAAGILYEGQKIGSRFVQCRSGS